MKMKYFALVIVINFLFANLAFSTDKDTIWNQTDNNGQKQGYWKVTYENGKPKYQAYFKNNKPQGEMRRYYDDGALKAIMVFEKESKKSRTKIYYQNGVLAAEGNFIDSMRDSIWLYYSFYDKTLKLSEGYKNGDKEGISIKYYEGGQKAEEIEWKNNQKNGVWNQYYKNGKLKIKANYFNDKRAGDFAVYYENTQPEIKGIFKDNLMEGEWTYFDETGNVKAKVIYNKGVPQNTAQLDKDQQEYINIIDQSKGKIPEPDENSLVPMK
jgi:antitoxin component YwqK of YwqJK toxin-antitoxin module